MKIKVTILPGGQSTVMNVGEGKQTFKWLSMVAMNRLHVAKPKGAVRQRDVQPVSLAHGAFMPARIDTRRTVKGEFPSIKAGELLASKLRDGDEVYITLVTKTKLDARGGVDMPYWHCTAFKSRTVAAQHKCQETMKLIRHKRKTRRKMAALRTGVAEIGSQLAMQSLLQFDNFDDEEEGLFVDDWKHMRVPPVVDSTAGPDETERVKELVHTNYKQLRELFRVYSNSMGSNNAGSADTFRISKNEFTSFCHDCRIGYGAVRSLPFNMIFTDALYGIGNSGYTAAASGKSLVRHKSSASLMKQQLMKRYQFLDAILLLAGHARNCSRAGRYETTGAPPVSEETLKELMEENILPRFRKLGGTGIRQEMRDRKVSHLVMRELDLLRRIFATYSADASAAGAGAAQTANTSLASIQMTVMTQQQFYKLMEDAGMYRPTINLRGKFDPKKDCDALDGKPLSDRDVGNAFVLAQAEDEGDDATKEAATTLVFSEFLEAVARAAHNKWKHRTKTGLHDHLALALDAFAVMEHFTAAAAAAASAAAAAAAGGGGAGGGAGAGASPDGGVGGLLKKKGKKKGGLMSKLGGGKTSSKLLLQRAAKLAVTQSDKPASKPKTMKL